MATAADIRKIQYCINYLESGSAGKPFDQTVSDVLFGVFKGVAGFDPDKFRDTPISTLLRLLLTPDIIPLAAAGVTPVQILPPQFLTFGVFAGTGITNTGATIINGDLGVSPGANVLGFPPGVVTGSQHVADAEAAQALIDLEKSQDSITDRFASGAGVVLVSGGGLAGLTLGPGLYTSTAPSFAMSLVGGNLILNGGGNPHATWFFNAGTSLTIGAGRSVLLTNGANAANVYWNIGTSAALQAGCIFHGNLIAEDSIVVSAGAAVVGRVLADNGSVTINASNITIPA